MTPKEKKSNQGKPQNPNQVSGPVHNLRVLAGTKLYIVFIINTLTSFYGLRSQLRTNEQIFDSLVLAFYAESQTRISRLEGFFTDSIIKIIPTDSASEKWLSLGSPEVKIIRCGKDSARRTLQFQAEIRDTLSGIAKPIEYTDTIPLKSIKKLRKTEQILLRGEDPRFLHHAVLPLLCVLAGVACIVTLFYLRS